MIELCSKCKQELKEGQIIIGQAWNGDGGDHLDCLAANAPVAERNPYMAIAARVAPAESDTDFETRAGKRGLAAARG